MSDTSLLGCHICSVEEYIMRFDVLIHDGMRVGCTSHLLDYNPVPFKGGVRFVGQQPE